MSKTNTSEPLWRFDFGDSLHRFAAWLETENRVAEVETELHLRDDRMLPASRSELIRCLNTIYALSACALEALRPGQKWPGDGTPDLVAEAFPDSPGTMGCGHVDCGGHYPKLVHDATFLNAILPFAIGQAQRHRESLSLVCVAIDRLHGIQELLGRAVADRLVGCVGETVISLIRQSDIVARLDDDRVVAVLPRSGDDGAQKIGEMICQKVAERRWLLPDQPGVTITVSVGSATYPSSADNVFSLFEAADDALAQAQARGRNRAVQAPPMRNSAPYEAVVANGAS
jgi:diguanylate cyclase (GGDEF)-like protein